MAAANPRRARLVFWLRLVVSLGLIAVLVRKTPDLNEILPTHRSGRTLWFLLAAALMTLVGVVLSAWRWQRVLQLLGAQVRLVRLVMSYLAGLFVGNVLPSTIGGDVVRVSRAAADTGSTEVAFASVALERLTGFLALPLLVFSGFALEPSLADHDHAWLAVIVGGVSLALLGTIVFLAGHPRIAGRYADHGNWLRFIGAVHKGVDALRREPRQAVAVMATALLYQFSVVCSLALLAEALQLGVPFAAMLAFVPAVAMVQVLPVSVSGLGIREGMFVLFLHPLGVRRGGAIALGLLWYASMLAVSALGFPSFAAGKRPATRSDTPATPNAPGHEVIS
jgi:uncharacterized protein (TIRG00374 family)